ncbi:glycosyltransferase family 2 protein [Anaeromyxobacter paludicola]|uniref:Glycosyltransferase 2-like domain-containing protein n=1 Tax=Anaeromyxobacter paludicola TaxID=2918171 RepID=A0ABM7X5J3_9BACT|nr:glycosyltransferase [Anaeromyxobacter paludicola]BDG07085.1 hypothetical protein AMPC_01980 [Anaeromyxobacter paludicola]
MSTAPLVSFIVLSYNYEKYIGQTIRSILGQTFQDFELLVVDDVSQDASLDVIRSFDDPRIRVHVNDRNLGATASYNRSVSLARGEYLSLVDADDWIDPRKTEKQLAAFRRDPSLDIVGSYVSVVDVDGKRHPQAAEIEQPGNQSLDFNHVATWNVRNSLCHSSTILRRSVHEKVGLNEESMVRAPDYELWVRALAGGCRFGMIPEPLTFYRLHALGATHGDPRATYWEISYLLLKNLVPLIERRALHSQLSLMLNWVSTHDQFALMPPIQRYRLLGMFLTSPALSSYADFERFVLSDEGEPLLSTAGRRLLSLFRAAPAPRQARSPEQELELDLSMFNQRARALGR